MNEQQNLLQVKGLTKNYRKQLIFNRVDFHLANNEWLGIVGENGSGKTTLAKIIARLETADEGQIFFKGKKQMEFSRNQWFRKVQLITQYTRRSLDPTKTIAKVLSEPLQKWQIVPKEQIKARIEQVITECNLSLRILDQTPLELSGGQYQRVCIALSLLIEPEILICDEITASLDKINELKILSLLKNRANLSVIIIAHDSSLIKKVCDNQLEMTNFK